MYAINHYYADDRMGDLIGRQYALLLVMVRFGIPLGVADRTIAEVCRESGVDLETFLAVVNLLVDEENFELVPQAISLPTLVKYLHTSHDYFLNYRLPQIRFRLEQALAACGQPDQLQSLVMQYFDEYVQEVQNHMDYEDHKVFQYVEDLLAGRAARDGYHIGIFSSRHDHVEERLVELKDIILKYIVTPSTHELNAVLFDIFACSDDLASHNSVEDNLFVPVIRYYETGRETHD